MENLEMEAITATKVTDEDRLNFWLRHVGAEEKKLAFVRYAFCWMQRLCPHYDGGFWELYDLSNGGFYMAPTDEKRMWLTWPGNYVDVEMSANAAGIVATLYALNGFAEQVSPVFREKHRQLYDYIESHPEAQAIYAAIE
ncbi:antirestriction protein [Bilophila wadsworthia]|uniref:antirestriction protein n=1 Tax=Bilophila wadsworthia TaxID=35833 RepID=UPI00321F81A7